MTQARYGAEITAHDLEEAADAVRDKTARVELEMLHLLGVCKATLRPRPVGGAVVRVADSRDGGVYYFG